MSTLETTLANLFPVLMLVGLISPLVALISAIIFYVHHRDRVEPGRRVPIIVFILALIVCAFLAGCFGLYLGLNMACPKLGNLCGLWAFLVTGPILMALGIFLVGLAVSLVQPAPGS
jgi:MFS family permease